MKRIIEMDFQKSEKNSNTDLKKSTFVDKSRKTLMLYDKLKKDLSVEAPTVFSAVLFLTCDVLSNIPLKNISKDTINRRVSFLASKGAKISSVVCQNVTDLLLEQVQNTKATKEELAKQVFVASKYSAVLLLEDFNQYKREICSRLDAPKQKFFKTICDVSCALIRSDTETLLFKNPEQRITDIEKDLRLKIDMQEREALKKMLFAFKLDRVKSIYQAKLMPQEKAKNDFTILKKMCRQVFIEMAGNRDGYIFDRKRQANSQTRGR